MAENRLDRSEETRAKTERPKAWQPPVMLPDPKPIDGFSFHWVRVAMQGQADAANVSSKLREGWEPCRAKDHPEIQLVMVENDRFKDNVVIGGLMLCKAPVELVEQRTEYYQTQTAGQMQAVDSQLMRENDARMPLFNTQKSEVSFGKG